MADKGDLGSFYESMRWLIDGFLCAIKERDQQILGLERRLVMANSDYDNTPDIVRMRGALVRAGMEFTEESPPHLIYTQADLDAAREEGRRERTREIEHTLDCDGKWGSAGRIRDLFPECFTEEDTP